MQSFKSVKDTLQRYVDGIKALDNTEVTKRLEWRQENAIKHLQQLQVLEDQLFKYAVGTTLKGEDAYNKINSTPNYNFKDTTEFKRLTSNLAFKNSVGFLLNMRFAEYFTLYDALQFRSPNAVVDGKNKYRKRIDNWREKFAMYTDENGKQLYTADFTDVQHILYQISAFMQTNAQIDTYRQENFKYMRDVIEKRRLAETDSTTDLSFDEVSKEIDRAKSAFENKLVNTLHKGYKKFYADLNENIENTARIGGFLLDRYIYGYSFDETVNRSLKRWFNYGQRSPLETQLIADIPYLSFPIRSIDNWINRFFDPAYMRLISDIVDGFYGQYADEDGQYDEYEQFMITNGWVPIAKNLGLRLGFGLYDVQNILTHPRATMLQRRNPILRGVATLMETKDVTQSLKALATVGVLSRTANTLGPRTALQTNPVVGEMISQQPKTLSTSFSFTFNYYDYDDYGKYTPYKYRNQNNNARYKRYENIYKNWFNKYGRMRQPRVDPIGLVKDIQWKSYVRHRQTQDAMRNR
jgi:hypothetical protein